MNEQKKYICVTGDIVASRSSEYSSILHNFPRILDDLSLLGFIKRKWTSEMVFRRYFLYRFHGTAQGVAKLEHVSKEAVNKFIKKYGFREIITVTQDFHRGIKDRFT